METVFILHPVFTRGLNHNYFFVQIKKKLFSYFRISQDLVSFQSKTSPNPCQWQLIFIWNCPLLSIIDTRWQVYAFKQTLFIQCAGSWPCLLGPFDPCLTMSEGDSSCILGLQPLFNIQKIVELPSLPHRAYLCLLT